MEKLLTIQVDAAGIKLLRDYVCMPFEDFFFFYKTLILACIIQK